MRKTSTLDALLSRPVQEILTAVLLERDAPWYFSDLAKRLGRSPSTLQRPLHSLIRAGIIRRWSDGNRVYFARERDCPFLSDIQNLLVKTVGLADILRGTLRSFSNRIQVAFVYGSIARGEERSQSDVDLLVIGSATLADLTPVLQKAERRLGRPINATIFPPRAFRDKIAQKNHFLRSVLAKEKIFVVGGADDLEQLTKPRKAGAARHKQSGTRRSARGH